MDNFDLRKFLAENKKKGVKEYFKAHPGEKTSRIMGYQKDNPSIPIVMDIPFNIYGRDERVEKLIDRGLGIPYGDEKEVIRYIHNNYELGNISAEEAMKKFDRYRHRDDEYKAKGKDLVDVFDVKGGYFGTGIRVGVEGEKTKVRFTSQYTEMIPNDQVKPHKKK